MNRMEKLPETEFEIMKVVWANEPADHYQYSHGAVG
jgi:predicted transcriptional regulator